MAQQQSYEALAHREGSGRLVRQTYVRTAGHCTFTVDEQVAAIDRMWQRLRTGAWPDLSPRAMNGLAGDGRYVAYVPPVFNRPFAG
ncbi:hypothetical protein [Saccharothrix luteola]|uniref:hypothetical protein n=1 Tax=Saccharothrix luteola TaxID=2893018 RepID=UPI001E37E02E|nr:hypothetical protein [Saccharothrix luteola]MCC8249753.1 hypothetical protein [Saccharothrix luteola]